jgi:hypothetical protein
MFWKLVATYIYFAEPLAARFILANLVSQLDISVLTTDRSTSMKSMMRLVSSFLSCYLYVNTSKHFNRNPNNFLSTGRMLRPTTV